MTMWQTFESSDGGVRRFMLEIDSIRLTVEDSGDGDHYQHMVLHFGIRSPQSREECQRTWPREAIKLAREYLDRFEARLAEEDA